MSHEAARTRSVLEACLEHGTDRVNAVRFQRIIALERRAATQEGEVRRLLDERLAQLVNACAEDLGAAPAAAPRAATTPPPDTRPRSALAELIGHIASRAAQDSEPASDAAALAVPSDTSIFADIRQVCAEVRTESQLRQALADAPADAGPLNSASLVHRALTRMRDLSPDYLEHFVAYVDALSALEPICARNMPAPNSKANPTGSRKPATSRTRRRPA